MNWTNFFDKIYVINLERRKDRMKQASEQLNKYNIPFERYEAIEHEKGAEGLRLTMVQLFNNAIQNNYQNILVLEDDLDIIEPEINDVMDEAVKDIPPYDIIYLGCQVCSTPTGFYSKNLLKGIRNAYATHATIYSLKAMKYIVEHSISAPIDNWICSNLQCFDKCFVIYPILISQIVTKSDIYKGDEVMDWRKYIQGRYWEQIQLMHKNKTFHNEAKIYDGQ